MGGGGGWNLRNSLNGKDDQVRHPGNQTGELLTVRRSEDLRGGAGGGQARLEPSGGADRCLNLDGQHRAALAEALLSGEVRRRGMGLLSVCLSLV